jgi:hypothetical protein
MSVKPAESMDSGSARCAEILGAFQTLTSLASSRGLAGQERAVVELCRRIGHEVLPVVGMARETEELLRKAEGRILSSPDRLHGEALLHKAEPRVLSSPDRLHGEVIDSMLRLGGYREAINALNVLGSAVEQAPKVRAMMRAHMTCDQIRSVESSIDTVFSMPPDIRETGTPVTLAARPALGRAAL